MQMFQLQTKSVRMKNVVLVQKFKNNLLSQITKNGYKVTLYNDGAKSDVKMKVSQ